MSRDLTPVPPVTVTNPERRPHAEARTHLLLRCPCKGELAWHDNDGGNSDAEAVEASAQRAR